MSVIRITFGTIVVTSPLRSKPLNQRNCLDFLNCNQVEVQTVTLVIDGCASRTENRSIFRLPEERFTTTGCTHPLRRMLEKEFPEAPAFSA